MGHQTNVNQWKSSISDQSNRKDAYAVFSSSPSSESGSQFSLRVPTTDPRPKGHPSLKLCSPQKKWLILCKQCNAMGEQIIFGKYSKSQTIPNPMVTLGFPHATQAQKHPIRAHLGCGKPSYIGRCSASLHSPTRTKKPGVNVDGAISICCWSKIGKLKNGTLVNGHIDKNRAPGGLYHFDRVKRKTKQGGIDRVSSTQLYELSRKKGSLQTGGSLRFPRKPTPERVPSLQQRYTNMGHHLDAQP